MDDVNGAPGQFRQLDGPVSGLTLHDRAPSQSVVDRVGLSPLQSLLDQDVDDDAVLGVHHDRRPVLGGLLHRLEDLAVGGVEDARIGHEHLEARHPFRDRGVHLLERLLVHVSDDQVEAVVDGAVALGLAHPRLEPVHQVLAFDLHREVDDRGRSSPGGRPSPGLEGVGGEGPAKGELHMGVHVDPARDHIFP